jgi:hypothetical protein
VAQSVGAGARKPRLLAAPWRSVGVCLLTLLIFLPYALLIFFFGGLPIGYGGGIGSPGGARDQFYESAPWLAVFVAAGLSALMVRKLLKEHQLVAPWKASLLLVLILLLLSAFVLWQMPLIPVPSIASDYLNANATLFMSLYPCFFSALASAFLCEPRDQGGRLRNMSWLRIPLLGILAALAGAALCWYAITTGLVSDQRYWQEYFHPPYSPLIAALYTLPTLVGVGLFGSFLGACLYRWLGRAFGRPVELARRTEQEESMAAPGEQAPAVASVRRVAWPGVWWGAVWRVGLSGLLSLVITGLLLHMQLGLDLRTNLLSYGVDPHTNRVIQEPFIYHPGPGLLLEIGFSPDDWLIPPFLASLWYKMPFLQSFSVFSLVFLPFLALVPGVLGESVFWKQRTVWLGLGVGGILLGIAIGAKDLLLTLLYYLGSFWPFGSGAAILYCATLLCETSVLALLAALALGPIHPPIEKWRRRLLWLLIGGVSFAGSLLPLVNALQHFVYYADGTAPFRFLSLSTPIIAITLAVGLLLSLAAAVLGGWLRAMLLGWLLRSRPPGEELASA